MEILLERYLPANIVQLLIKEEKSEPWETPLGGASASGKVFSPIVISGQPLYETEYGQASHRCRIIVQRKDASPKTVFTKEGFIDASGIKLELRLAETFVKEPFLKLCNYRPRETYQTDWEIHEIILESL